MLVIGTQLSAMADSLESLFASQDQLATRKQTLQYVTEEELRSVLGRVWQVVLPGIYASSLAALTPRQRVRAGLLKAGEHAQLADSTALAAYRLPYLPPDDRVRLTVPDDVHRASREFVVIRRTIRPAQPVIVSGLPTAPMYRAVCEFVARHPDERASLAVAAAAVQRGGASVDQLMSEAWEGPARGRPRQLRVFAALQAGVRSAPEGDFRDLVLKSRSLPEPLWNCLIQLPNGRLVSPDALWTDAGLVHEVNGKEWHSEDLAGEDAFEDMQRRSDAMVTAGLTVLSNTPRRISREGKQIGEEILACYRRQAGCGLPPGVQILRYGPPGSPSNVALLGNVWPSDPTSPQQCGVAG